MSRAIGAIWMCIGISLFLFCLSITVAGHGEQRAVLAAIEIMLGCANATSSVILKWKTQFFCALVWWTAGVFSCFGTANQTSIVFLVAIFLGQIVFGTYMILSEARERRQGVVHA